MLDLCLFDCLEFRYLLGSSPVNHTLNHEKMTRHFVILLPLVLSSLLSTPAWSSGPKSEELLTARQEFVAAEENLKSGNLVAYAELKQRLQNYPLFPYLEFQELRKRVNTLKDDEFKVALQNLSGTPLHRLLLRDWLQNLAKKQDWERYLRFASPGGTVIQQCRRLHAMITTGHRQSAYQEVPAIWLHGHSRPEACDSVFQAWIKSGNLTDELVWQRIELAMEANQIRLARYLKRFLPETEQEWVDRWVNMHQDPSNPASLLAENHPYRDAIITHVIRKMARLNAKNAYQAWDEIHARSTFTDQQHLSVARTLAAYWMHEDDGTRVYQKLAKLMPEHLRTDSRLFDKQLQVALLDNDWELIMQTIKSLPPAKRSDEPWRYWHARALSQSGQYEEALNMYESLAQARSYYGFLAADRLGVNFNFLHQTLPANEIQIEQVAKLPGLIRARELLALERTLEARREWNLALAEKSTPELMGAAKLAEHWNWPSQSILTLARIGYWNDLKLRFPLDHRQEVDQQAKAHGLDSAWIYAILRQESAFMSDARSHAGALGLMQLMPRTAKEVATRNQIEAFKINDLFQPNVNIKLGSTYLKQIFYQMRESPVLATAAYNAGPSRVKNWLPKQAQPMDVWIETIPFRETRKYLKRVLAYTLIYAYRMGKTPERLPENWLKPIEPIHYYTQKTPKKETDA
jgi:soluble lytic murein transglycosylase